MIHIKKKPISRFVLSKRDKKKGRCEERREGGIVVGVGVRVGREKEGAMEKTKRNGGGECGHGL